MLGFWAVKERRYGSGFNAIAFRRTTVSSEDAIERSKQIFGPLGGKFNASKLIWRMPNGGRVSFKYLESVKDAEEYQGRNVSDAWVEEVGQYPDPAPIDMLFGALRSSSGVPEQLILTGNPGGAGQHWNRSRYELVPFPTAPKVVTRAIKTEDGPHLHKMAVIPSRLSDNKILLSRSKNYKARLHLVGSQELVKAWLDGDYSAVPGAFFDCWSEKRHVVPPFNVPDHWLRFAAMDWGSASPFSVGWYAVASDPVTVEGMERGTRVIIPRGCLIKYREWYGGTNNVGLKMSNAAIAEGIKAREKNEKIAYRVLDPACFAEDGGPSIAETFALAGVHFRKADNRRVTRNGSISGWAQMRSRLIGLEGGAGPAMLVFFSHCKDSIRTIPVVQHDRTNPEDVDTDGDDHASDETRYGCMSRPWLQDAPTAALPKKDYSSYGDTDRDAEDSWRTA